MEARTPTSLPEVTERQLEVAELIARGLDNPGIARELGISLAGAKYHVSELLARLNLSSREEVARWYRDRERGHPFRRLGLAPLGWVAGAIGGAAAAAIAVAAITLGSDGGERSEPVSSVASPVPAVATVVGDGAFVDVSQPLVSSRLGFTTAPLADGRVLLVGATGGGSRAAEIFDPASDAFELAADTVEARRLPQAVLLQDGDVLVLGGLGATSGEVLASAELYDPASDRFELAAPMVQPRWGAGAVTLDDGRVLITGGVIENPGDGTTVITDGAELYDPARHDFTVTGSMHFERRDPHLALLGDGRVMVTGGGPLEIYDPATGEFYLFGGEPIPWHDDAVPTVLANGEVLLTGVYIDEEAAQTRDSHRATASFVIDATTGAVRRAGNLSAGRSRYHSATLLPDGRVLVAGGATGSGRETVYPPSEVFDPATETWKTISSIAAPQVPGGQRATNVVTHIAGHTMTRLEDGSLLVVGRVRRGQELVVGAERFVPTATAIGDRYAAVLTALQADPPGPGDVLDAAGSLFIQPGGEPFQIGSLVAAATEQGLQLRGLPTGIGVCGSGAVGSGAGGVRAELVDGSGTEDFAVYIYESPEALGQLWEVDEDGQVTPRPGSECADRSTGGYFINLGASVMANGNQLLVLDHPGGLAGFDEHDAEVRAALIEAFEAMEPAAP